MRHTLAQSERLTERPKRILLAEDDPSFRTFLAEVLRADGHDVVEVSDGQRLLEVVVGAMAEGANGDGIDLIVSDIRMPKFNALEVVGTLRSASILLPSILMTAFGDSSTHQQARLLGVLGVLDKPFELNAFRTAISDALFGHIVAVMAPVNECATVA